MTRIDQTSHLRSSSARSSSSFVIAAITSTPPTTSHPLPSPARTLPTAGDPMSLFGTSPEAEDPSAVSSTQKSKASLFADEPAGGSSSLFADDTGDDSSSWNPQSNTAKRTARRDLVRTLLPATDVPESYVDAYDLILNSGDRVGSGVGLSSIREILSSSNLTASDQGKILNLVVSGDNETSGGLGRPEFNVLLALIGLAQEGEDLSFDAVDDHRKSKSFASHRYSRLVIAFCFPTPWEYDNID